MLIVLITKLTYRSKYPYPRTKFKLCRVPLLFCDSSHTHTQQPLFVVESPPPRVMFLHETSFVGQLLFPPMQKMLLGKVVTFSYCKISFFLFIWMYTFLSGTLTPHSKSSSDRFINRLQDVTSYGKTFEIGDRCGYRIFSNWGKKIFFLLSFLGVYRCSREKILKN